MRVELWQHTDVRPDGTREDRDGSLIPYPMFRTSRENQYETPSAIDAGDWLNVSTGRLPDGTVTGITLYFDSRQEMEDFIITSGIS